MKKIMLMLVIAFPLTVRAEFSLKKSVDSLKSSPSQAVTEASEASTKEIKWRGESEANANGLTDADSGSYKRIHESVKKTCGHDVKVTFEWSTLKYSDWHAWSMADWGTEFINTMDTFCGGASYKDYKPKVAKIKTINVHGKPCDQLPFAAPGHSESGPGIEYKLSKDGTSVDKYICPKSSIYTGYDTMWWIKENL